MKGVRSFLVLLVVAAALGGFLYYDSKRAPADDKKQEKVFAGVAADKIEQVTVKSASGEQTTVEKQGTAWQVTQPAPAPADEAELSGHHLQPGVARGPARDRRAGDGLQAVRPRPGATSR